MADKVKQSKAVIKFPDPPNSDFWLYSPQVEDELTFVITQLRMGANEHPAVTTSLKRLGTLGYPEAQVDFIRSQFLLPRDQRGTVQRSPQVTQYFDTLITIIKDTIATKMEMDNLGDESIALGNKLLDEVLLKRPVSELNSVKNSLLDAARKRILDLLPMKDLGQDIVKAAMAPKPEIVEELTEADIRAQSFYPEAVETELVYIDAQLEMGNDLHPTVIEALDKVVSLGYPQEQADCTKAEFDRPPNERRLSNRSVELVAPEIPEETPDGAPEIRGTIPACINLASEEPQPTIDETPDEPIPEEPAPTPPPIKDATPPSVDALKKKMKDKIEKEREQTSLESFGTRDSKNVYRV